MPRHAHAACLLPPQPDSNASTVALQGGLQGSKKLGDLWLAELGRGTISWRLQTCRISGSFAVRSGHAMVAVDSMTLLSMPEVHLPANCSTQQAAMWTFHLRPAGKSEGRKRDNVVMSLPLVFTFRMCLKR